MKTNQSRFLKIFLGVIAASLLVVRASGVPPVLPPVPNTVDSITPTELKMHLEFLASDELGGRYSLAPNFAIAARYLASRLEAYGFKGAGDKGGFFQSFEVVSSKPDVQKCSLEILANGQTSSFGAGDFVLFRGNASGQAQGKVVFVGTGISSPEQKHDDYAGVDVTGKIVLIMPGIPPGVDMSKVGDQERGAGAARAHGAIAILQLPQQRFADRMKDKAFLERLSSFESVRLAKDVDGELPTMTLGLEAADKLLAPAGLSLNGILGAVAQKQKLQPKELPILVKMAVVLQQTRSKTQNVVGILEGTDPRLKDEYVTFSAHYDHLKTGPNGEIYHGADDDGSGTSAVLAIAHAMSLDPPKRSVLVIFHAGEELGLLGSEYNADFAPVVPLNKIVVDLNIDMIGRSKQPGDNAQADEHLTDGNTVYLVGSNRISPELHQISEQTNRQFQKLRLNYYYNDPNNPERIYFRSDHWNYAKHGIPIIFYFDGTHVDYHKPTDTVDKIDFNKMTEVARLVFETGWRLANLDHHLAKSAS